LFPMKFVSENYFIRKSSFVLPLVRAAAAGAAHFFHLSVLTRGIAGGVPGFEPWNGGIKIRYFFIQYQRVDLSK